MRVDTANATLSVSDRLRIGRLIFDGADPVDIAKRFGLHASDMLSPPVHSWSLS